ncbi:hypothetical protein EDB84DRAFT_1443546 [Lactarius hengduanensis]|nr:hypothetical protein EDB84DRAFT_1443546 [Lactarius hengduanensis]
MSSLLEIACRVEAAMDAYGSVKEHTDKELWKKQLEHEKDKSIQAFFQAKEQHPMKEEPALHPILAALTIVLKRGEDLSLIAPNHPDLLMHKYYKASAVFPDLHSFLPSREDRWWEDIVAKSLQVHMPEIPVSPAGSEEGLAAPDGPAVSGELPVAPEKFAASDELPAAPEELAAPDELPAASVELPAASAALEELTAPDTSAAPEEPTMPQASQKIKFLPLKQQPSQPAEDNDVEMKEVGEPVKDKITPQRRRKRKAADAPAAAKSSKRVARDSPPQAQPALPQIKFECDRCAEKGLVCKTSPTRPCDRCQADKAKCSLVPNDPITGKPIRGKLSESFVLLFRLEQLKKKVEKAGGAEEPAASGSRLSPSSVLEQPLHGMTLESGGSSHADSPTTEPPSVPSPLANTFSVEVPGPKFRQGRHLSPAAVSQSSDDGRNHEARLAVLEAKMNALEEWRKEVDRRLEEGGL